MSNLIVAISTPIAVAAHEILLNVRQVKGGDFEPALTRVAADGSHRLLTSHVADNGDDPILELHRAHELKRGFVCEIADPAAATVGRHDQAPERGIVITIVATEAGESRVQPLGDERRAVAIDHLAIARRQRHTEL